LPGCARRKCGHTKDKSQQRRYAEHWRTRIRNGKLGKVVEPRQLGSPQLGRAAQVVAAYVRNTDAARIGTRYDHAHPSDSRKCRHKVLSMSIRARQCRKGVGA
jgi:hypothetical protein